ncbi:MAG: HAMP domain-containing histidine kinase [Marinobacterium sp.]|nr:HAMP domain-containing histidine kinase [Marinobacterium sp.]
MRLIQIGKLMIPSLRWQPRSLHQLILISFLLVVTPLCVLIFQSSKSLTHQNDVLREYAHQALDSTARAQTLNQISEDLLRASRQLQIVAHNDIATRLKQQADNYSTELGIQSFWLDNDHQIQQLGQLLKQLLQQPDKAELAQQLYEQTHALDQTLRMRLQHRLNTLNSESSRTRQQAWLLTLALLSLSALLIMVLLGTINRPVQQLSTRIRALGQGNRKAFNGNCGPKELTALHDELNWLAQQLDTLEQDKQRFLRHMSHELKTPLTSLREGSDLLAEGVTGPLNADQQDVIELLQSQSRALQALIEQLLDYNHISQGVRLRLEPLELTQLINEALSPFRLIQQQKRIRLCQPDHPQQWHSDRLLLTRTLSNLLSNAILYSQSGGELAIQAQITSDQLILDISNQGPIIPDIDLPHLFEPFYQGENRRSGPVQGSGIGLSIAHDACQALGGQLTLHHNSNGLVTFRLILPAVNTEAIIQPRPEYCENDC